MRRASKRHGSAPSTPRLRRPSMGAGRTLDTCRSVSKRDESSGRSVRPSNGPSTPSWSSPPRRWRRSTSALRRRASPRPDEPESTSCPRKKASRGAIPGKDHLLPPSTSSIRSGPDRSSARAPSPVRLASNGPEAARCPIAGPGTAAPSWKWRLHRSPRREKASSCLGRPARASREAGRPGQRGSARRLASSSSLESRGFYGKKPAKKEWHDGSEEMTRVAARR